MASNNGENEKMTVQEAGRKGGEATARTHDRGFYEEIGREGGQKSPGNFRNDPERASAAGRKGGQARSSDNNQNDQQ
ncbi:MAG TPA: general stress protein [Candidatus Saccharimonas sp.]|nr:general stress protein [Candidatus Saccharimonas sp.]